MKVIVAGSRTIASYRDVSEAIRDSGFEISELVCGGAPGVDGLGERWALINQVPIKFFHAEWGTWGNAAGPIRNAQMAEYADALIAVWDGRSRGTSHMIREAYKHNLKVFVKKV